MKRINLLLSLLSFDAIIIVIERFSTPTQIILYPYSFLRLHQVIQMLVIIPFGVVIMFFLFKEMSKNFSLLKHPQGILLGLLFFLGIYLYATGNGLHELASYLFNTFCPYRDFSLPICKSTYFNDYIFGNSLYFVGLLFVDISLVFFERMAPQEIFTKKDIVITFLNSIVFAGSIVAYAAYDRIVIGILFGMIAAIITSALLITSKKKYFEIPFTCYCVIGSVLGTIIAIWIRLHTVVY